MRIFLYGRMTTIVVCVEFTKLMDVSDKSYEKEKNRSKKIIEKQINRCVSKQKINSSPIVAKKINSASQQSIA